MCVCVCVCMYVCVCVCVCCVRAGPSVTPGTPLSPPRGSSLLMLCKIRPLQLVCVCVRVCPHISGSGDTWGCVVGAVTTKHRHKT